MNANELTHELIKKLSDPSESLLNTKDLPKEVIDEIKKDIDNGKTVELIRNWTIKTNGKVNYTEIDEQKFSKDERCKDCGKEITMEEVLSQNHKCSTNAKETKKESDESNEGSSYEFFAEMQGAGFDDD